MQLFDLISKTKFYQIKTIFFLIILCVIIYIICYIFSKHTLRFSSMIFSTEINQDCKSNTNYSYINKNLELKDTVNPINNYNHYYIIFFYLSLLEIIIENFNLLEEENKSKDFELSPLTLNRFNEFYNFLQSLDILFKEDLANLIDTDISTEENHTLFFNPEIELIKEISTTVTDTKMVEEASPSLSFSEISIESAFEGNNTGISI